LAQADPLDPDGDTVPSDVDNCPDRFNVLQVDTDGDGQGAVCDSDDDGDGFFDELPSGGPPVAVDDAATVAAGASLVVPAPGVLANDIDLLDVLTAFPFGAPAHGTLSLEPDGAYRYTPAPGYVGADSFTYVARDRRGGESLATVRLTIAAAPTTWRAVITLTGRTTVTVACDVQAPSVTNVGRGVTRLRFAAAGPTPSCALDALGVAPTYVGVLAIGGGAATGRYGVLGQWSSGASTFTGLWSLPGGGAGRIVVRLTPPA
jgi:hypothetical protein